MPDSALHAVTPAIGFHRVNSVVVGCSRLEVVHAHAENGIGMARVQPDWRLRGLAQFCGIRTVAHDAIMPPGLLLVHLTIAKSGSARSTSGPPMIRTLVVLLVVGLSCASTRLE
jgi:hypothetical protein